MVALKAHCSLLPPAHGFHRIVQLLLSFKPVKPGSAEWPGETLTSIHLLRSHGRSSLPLSNQSGSL